MISTPAVLTQFCAAVSKSPAHTNPSSQRKTPPAVLSMVRVLPAIPELLNMCRVNKLKNIYKDRSYVGAVITLLCKLYTT